MDKILEIAFSGFWSFCGITWLIAMFLTISLNFISKIVSRSIRGNNIKQHGWPPSHLDADGDWKKNIDEL